MGLVQLPSYILSLLLCMRYEFVEIAALLFGGACPACRSATQVSTVVGFRVMDTVVGLTARKRPSCLESWSSKIRQTQWVSRNRPKSGSFTSKDCFSAGFGSTMERRAKASAFKP